MRVSIPDPVLNLGDVMKKLVVSLAAMVVASAAQAAPVQWTVGSGGNGHYYEFISAGVTQGTALTAAAAASYLGNQGYLATVTSQGEQDFLHGLSTTNAWIGAEYSNGAWRWATGPEAGQSFFGTANPDINYSFWNSGEPNGNSGEPAVTMNWNSGTGQWNDWSPGNGASYFVEYGGFANGVPEPAAWAMLVGGFGLLGAASRRRKSATVFA